MPTNYTQIKKVFSSKIANELINQGFHMIGVEPNMKKPQFNVFLFENTPELQEAFDKIISKH